METAVVYHKEQFPIKPIVSMSCKLCKYKITCLTRRLAKLINA